MKPLTNKAVMAVSAFLVAPATILCTVGMLYLTLRWHWINNFLGAVIGTGIGRVLFSPWTVLGGALLCLLLNLWQVCRLRYEEDDQHFVVSLSVTRGLGHLALAVVAFAFITLLFWYAFVENFQIVAR